MAPTRFVRTLLCMLVQYGCGFAHAGEVIAHPSVRVATDEIRDIYLGEKQLDGGLKLTAVDNTVEQEAFLAAILQTTRRNYDARWTRKTFREGVRAPIIKGGDIEVINFVRATPGAIGYIQGTASSGVRVIVRY